MLDGLIFQPPGTQTTQQTRQGVPIYGGGAQGFEEWQFKIEGRVKAIEAQCDPDDPESVRKMRNQLIKLSTDVVDALEDDSLRIAMEIGHENLSTVTGVTTLIQRIEESIPYGDKQDDARTLFHIGAKNKGPFAANWARAWSRTLLADANGG